MTAAGLWWIASALALCCCGAATALGLVLRHAASARRRYEARLAEHDRIAHEMHDWLLQSTQGLMLRVQAVSRSNPPEFDQPDAGNHARASRPLH